MNFTVIKQQAYEKALALMDEFIEDYDNQRPLIEVLSSAIERWESEAEEFSEFNTHLNDLDSGIAVLRVLMDQHKLTGSDLPEIGTRSLISKILSGERSLTKQYIESLSSLLFNIEPAVFFN
ncbi:MAG: transcriptional regulator [Gammaproteobacteria bacterium]|nr:transcriptional regulator [Gammaproteobacteria bacterium]